MVAQSGLGRAWVRAGPLAKPVGEVEREGDEVTLALFAVDLVIPDFLPFIDEILLGLGTLLLANFKRRKESQPPLQPPSTSTTTLPATGLAAPVSGTDGRPGMVKVC